jgi:hypothetical protein
VETHGVKLPVLADDCFIVYVEHAGKNTFVHMDVAKWNKNIKQRFTESWFPWAAKQMVTLYAMPFIDDKKMAKWVKFCGFDLLNHHICTDGVTRKLYVWRNNHG